MDIDIDIYPYYFRIQNSEIKNFSCLISSIKTAENGLKNGGFQMDCVLYIHDYLIPFAQELLLH